MTFKRRRFECDTCHDAVVVLKWDGEQPDPCPCGGTWHQIPMVHEGCPAPAVIDDQIEGGPRRFETMGDDAPYIETRSQWKREAEKRGLVNVVRHDQAYYAKQRKLHDEELRDTGRNEAY